jgi:hypothetical protein
MDDKTPKSLWGPWSPIFADGRLTVDQKFIERKAQLRCLRTLIHVMLGSRKAPDYTDTVKHLIIALRIAEEPGIDQDIKLDHARLLFDALPAARQRDIIATFAVLHEPLVPSKERD